MTKDIKECERTVRWRGTWGEVQKGPNRSFCPRGVGGPSSSTSRYPCSPTRRVSKPHPLGVRGGSVRSAGWIEPLAAGDSLNLQPLTSRKGAAGGVVLRVATLSWLGWFPWQAAPIPGGFPNVTVLIIQTQAWLKGAHSE